MFRICLISVQFIIYFNFSKLWTLSELPAENSHLFPGISDRRKALCINAVAPPGPCGSSPTTGNQARNRAWSSFKNLNPSTGYTLVATKNGFMDDSISVKTKENENVPVTQFLRKAVKEKPITEVYEPSNVYFEFDSSEITTRSAEELDKLVAVLKENEGLSLKIASHTDARGPAAYNRLLSDRRAKSTKQYIFWYHNYINHTSI